MPIPAVLQEMTSDRVRKIFDLTNGNQREVVQAQKQRGVQVLQVLRQTTKLQSNIRHDLHQRVALHIPFVLLPLHGIADRFWKGRHAGAHYILDQQHIMLPSHRSHHRLGPRTVGL